MWFIAGGDRLLRERIFRRQIVSRPHRVVYPIEKVCLNGSLRPINRLQKLNGR